MFQKWNFLPQGGFIKSTCRDCVWVGWWWFQGDKKKVPRSCFFPAPHAWVTWPLISGKTKATIKRFLGKKDFCTFGLCWLCSPSCCPGNLSAAPPCSCCIESTYIAFSQTDLFYTCSVDWWQHMCYLWVCWGYSGAGRRVLSWKPRGTWCSSGCRARGWAWRRGSRSSRRGRRGTGSQSWSTRALWSTRSPVAGSGKVPKRQRRERPLTLWGKDINLNKMWRWIKHYSGYAVPQIEMMRSEKSWMGAMKNYQFESASNIVCAMSVQNGNVEIWKSVILCHNIMGTFKYWTRSREPFKISNRLARSVDAFNAMEMLRIKYELDVKLWYSWYSRNIQIWQAASDTIANYFLPPINSFEACKWKSDTTKLQKKIDA